MQLRDDHALRAVHDERAVRRHQRNIAKEDFLLLDVANSLVAGLRILVVNGQADRHLQRGRERHAALFALLLVILQLQADRIAALVTEVGNVLVVRSALVAEHITWKERISDYHGAAMRAGGTQVMETLEVAALALPVADGVVDEVQLRNAAEVSNGENRNKHRLQPRVITLVGQLIHLQKALIGASLHFDQVGNLGCGWNLGKIEPAANRALLVRHASLLSLVTPALFPLQGSRQASTRVSEAPAVYVKKQMIQTGPLRDANPVRGVRQSSRSAEAPESPRQACLLD